MSALVDDAVTIRTASAADVDGVLAVWEVARSTAADQADGREDVLALLERSPDGLLVAENEGRLVGTLVAVWDGWRGSMARLAVLPEHRRRGIAQKLVDAGHERLRAAGAKRVNVLIADTDAGAADLWVGLGYEYQPWIKRYKRDL